MTAPEAVNPASPRLCGESTQAVAGSSVSCLGRNPAASIGMSPMWFWVCRRFSPRSAESAATRERSSRWFHLSRSGIGIQVPYWLRDAVGWLGGRVTRDVPGQPERLPVWVGSWIDGGQRQAKRRFTYEFSLLSHCASFPAVSRQKQRVPGTPPSPIRARQGARRTATESPELRRRPERGIGR